MCREMTAPSSARMRNNGSRKRPPERPEGGEGAISGLEVVSLNFEKCRSIRRSGGHRVGANDIVFFDQSGNADTACALLAWSFNPDHFALRVDEHFCSPGDVRRERQHEVEGAAG